MSDNTITNRTALAPKFGWKPSQLYAWLTAPHVSITDATARRESTLMATMTIVTMGVGLILIAIFLLIAPEQLNVPDVQATIIGVLLLPIAYLLTRYGYVSQAVNYFVILLFATFLLPSFLQGSGATTLAFATIPILIGGILLKRGRYIFYVLIINLYVLFMIVINLENPIMAVNLAYVQYFSMSFFLILISVLVYVFVTHLRTTESHRRRALEVANEALRLSEIALERRVAERTKELDIARQEAEAAREIAEKANEVKSQFLANMSHELRTPLNSILNFTAFVADGIMGPVNEEQVDALQQSIGSGKHLLALINDVLDITKIEAGLMDMFIQEVDLNESIQVVVSMSKGLLKNKTLAFNTEIEEKLPITYGDKRRIRQVFLNVISNAIKFTREGSVTVRLYSKDAHIHFEVSDTGIGIAPEEQHLVFESFKQAKHDSLDTPGTGLGMPISKFFVEAHGGEMSLTSEVGVGTTFFVVLPILTEAEATKLGDESRNKTLTPQQ